jgi:hypothetical protein
MSSRSLIGVVTLCLAAGAWACGCKSNNIVDTTNNTTENTYVTQLVGASGGFVTGPGGSTVNIPANALTESVSIQVGRLVPSDYPVGMPAIPPGWSVKGFAFSFQPHGQAFGLPVTVTVPYAGATPSEVALVTASPSGKWKTVQDAVIGDTSAQVDAPHFSYYAVVTGAPSSVADAGHDSGSTDDAGPLLTITGDRKIIVTNDAAIGYSGGAGASDGGAYTYYQNLPASLNGTVGNYTLNNSLDIQFELSGSTTCYMIRNSDWTAVDAGGWASYVATGPSYFSYEATSTGTIDSKTLGPGTYWLSTFSAMYACKAH